MRLSLRLVWGLPKLVALPTPPSSVNKGRPSYIPLFVPPPTLSWPPSAARAGIMLYEIFAGKMLALRSDFMVGAEEVVEEYVNKRSEVSGQSFHLGRLRDAAAVAGCGSS